MHSHIIAETGLDFFANFTGANSVAPNFSSAHTPLGIAPGGNETLIPCSSEQNIFPFSSMVTVSTRQIESSGGEGSKTNSKMRDQYNEYHCKTLIVLQIFVKYASVYNNNANESVKSMHI